MKLKKSTKKVKKLSATLHFDLTDLDGRTELLRCTKSLDLALVLYELADAFRAMCKYTEEGESGTMTYGEIREMFHEHLRARGIDLDELLN